MTSPSDEVFNGAAAWAEVAELNQRLYDAREALERILMAKTLSQARHTADEALHPTQNEGAP